MEQIRALPEGFLGPIKNKPVWIGKRMICPSSTEDENGWRIHFEISDDEGKTWRKIGPITASEIVETDQVKFSNQKHKTIQVIQPTILTHKDGKLQLYAVPRTTAPLLPPGVKTTEKAGVR